MTTKHTPGPWRAKKVRTLIHIGGDSGVCEISVSASHVHEDFPGAKMAYIARQEANAHLIAAAPDLLEALQALVADFADYPASERPCHAFDLARAAIAKALGHHPTPLPDEAMAGEQEID